MMRQSMMILTLFLLVVGVGCGDATKQSDPDAGTPGKDPSTGTYTGDLNRDLANLAAEADCAYYFECTDRPVTQWEVVSYKDKAECLADLQPAYRAYMNFDASAEAGRINVDEGLAEACLSAWTKKVGEQPCRGLSGQPPSVCRKMFGGAVAEGGACEYGFECAAGRCGYSYGEDGETACYGRCRTVATKGEGASCGEGSDGEETTCDPAQNLVCDAGTCVKRESRAAGAPCWNDGVCQAGLVCDWADDTAETGTCRSFAIVGEGAECGELAYCKPGLICIPGADGETGRCRAPVAEGKACLGDVESSNCGPGLYCDAGRCAALKSEGEACDAMECQWHLECVGATETAGGSCRAPEVCQIP